MIALHLNRATSFDMQDEPSPQTFVPPAWIGIPQSKLPFARRDNMGFKTVALCRAVISGLTV
jgi:hypothetical protein